PVRARQDSAGGSGDAVHQAAWPVICSRRDVLGAVAVSTGAARVQVAIPAAVSGSVAWIGRCGLGGLEYDGNSFAGISGQGGYLLSARDDWGDCVHVVASHYGRQAGRRRRRDIGRGGLAACWRELPSLLSACGAQRLAFP